MFLSVWLERIGYPTGLPFVPIARLDRVVRQSERSRGQVALLSVL